MKTGFTCDSGFNVVASATRNGRRLVAVVLGAPPSPRGPTALPICSKAVQVLLRKSVFGRTVDGLAMQASLSDEPTHLRNAVCGQGRAKPARKRTAVRIKPKSTAAN